MSSGTLVANLAGRIVRGLLLAGCLVLVSHPCRAAAAPAASPADSTSGARTVWDLGQAVTIALANHPLVQESADEIAAAAARRQQAESAYYPTVSLSSGVSEARTFSSSAGGSTSARVLEGGGRFSQVITDFGRRGAGLRRSDSLLSASKEEGRATHREVSFQAKVAYFNVLRARRILSVSRETVSQREALLRQAHAFYEAGIRARIDVARAEANLYQARSELTRAENESRVARITLLNRMGIDGPRDFDLVDALATETLPGTAGDWAREAEENRPQLRALLHRQRAAESALLAARAEHRPLLTANAGAGAAGEEFPLDREHDLSLRLEVPLFSGFLVSARVREADANLSSVKQAVIDLRRRIRLEVEAAALSMEESRERIAAREKELEASGENLRLATGRYEVGAGDIIEMIDAQVQSARADTGHIDALYDYSVSVAALLRAIGR